MLIELPASPQLILNSGEMHGSAVKIALTFAIIIRIRERRFLRLNNYEVTILI
jgi:hypothetical protein